MNRVAGALRYGAVILGAGRSSRMGQPKLLLPWGQTSILGHLISAWTTLGAGQIAVVCARGDEGLASELDRLGFPASHRIFNANPDRGMFSSIQCAPGWQGWDPALTHIALILGDQPHLRRETRKHLVDFSAAHPESICQPARGGRPRHPIVFPWECFRRLAGSPGPTLKEFLATQKVALWESDDPGLDLDLDRPEDYEAALKQYGSSARL